MLKKVRVLIVDDSALVREILDRGLSLDPGIEVVGRASDVYAARDKIVFLKPDVITLDIEMPGMDGVEFLKRLMPQYPLPVVVVSSLSLEGSRITLDALKAGAVDYIPKPSSNIGSGLKDMILELSDKIKTAAAVDVSKWKKSRDRQIGEAVFAQAALDNSTDKVIAIGASTGGTIAIDKIIRSFPSNMPGTVIVQHMPPVFTKMFAESLNKTSRVEVKEAENGDRVITGRVLIAPGGYQMEVTRSGGQYRVKCFEGEKVNSHCPSVDVLFKSVASSAGSNAVGVILTGMGRDGADGMLAMHRAGARNLAQDEETCVVYGMPKEAVKTGGVDKTVSLFDLTDSIVRMIQDMRG